MVIGYVYKIVNPLGKIYVGSTKNVRQRIRQYACAGCRNQPKIQASLLKYGFSTHSFEILWEGDISEMYEKEREFGITLNVLDRENGLNINLPNDGDKPKIFNPEFGEKISKSRKGRFTGKDNNFYGRKHSEEFKKQRSVEREGKYSGSNNPNFGKRWYNKKKEKLSCKLNKLINSPLADGAKNKPGNCKTVYQYDLNKKLIATHPSRSEAHRITKRPSSSIYQVLLGEMKQTGGFIFSNTLL